MFVTFNLIITILKLSPLEVSPDILGAAFSSQYVKDMEDCDILSVDTASLHWVGGS
jgi:hypothetical protein